METQSKRKIPISMHSNDAIQKGGFSICTFFSQIVFKPDSSFSSLKDLSNEISGSDFPSKIAEIYSFEITCNTSINFCLLLFWSIILLRIVS
jgi:hypothetical protein